MPIERDQTNQVTITITEKYNAVKCPFPQTVDSSFLIKIKAQTKAPVLLTKAVVDVTNTSLVKENFSPV